MEYSEFKEKIYFEIKKEIDIDLSEIQCQSFFNYMTLLLEKNKVMNLTAIDDPNEIIIKHFVDSCIVIKYYDFKNKTIIDVGTGAGFPGIPLAIINCDTSFVLSDTLGKRINFLSDVIKNIKLSNVEVIKARAEDLAHNSKYREKFDFAVARAVANLSTLSEYCLPFIKVSGKFLSYKMDNCNDEISNASNSIVSLGGMFHVKHSYDLILSEPKRCIIEVIKMKTTPKQYPRKAGTPSKQPL